MLDIEGENGEKQHHFELIAKLAVQVYYMCIQIRCIATHLNNSSQNEQKQRIYNG